MFYNYLKTSLRNLLRYKGYTLINIIGLTLGLASSILILLFVLDELSYDRFHTNYDRLYRVSARGNINGQDVTSNSSCNPIGPTLVKELPGVEQYVRFYPANALVQNGEKRFMEDGMMYADSTFFDVFTTRPIAGNIDKALTKPDALVITRSIAMKYFGSTDVIGQTLKLFNPPRTFSVEGVIEDYPSNSHFRFTMLASYLSYPNKDNTLWVSNSEFTYIRIDENSTRKEIEARMVDVVDKYVGPQVLQFVGIKLADFKAGGNSYYYALTPITEIHLKPVLGTLYIFSLIALFLILIASINFMNLATARASSRAREVGIRKVVGSLRSHLVGQFLTESSLLTLISFLLAILFVFLALPFFNDLTNKNLSIDLINWQQFIPILLVLLVIISLLSGSYPSFYLARFNPVSVLKGKLQMGVRSGWLRRVLVMIQFFITIGLIICTLIVYQQNRYIVGKDLNFDKENLLIINGTRALGANPDLFTNQIRNLPEVIDVTLTRHLPGDNEMSSTTFRKEGDTSDKFSIYNNFNSDCHFAATLKIDLVAGRYFSKDYASDSSAVVINEAAARKLEWTDPIDKNIFMIGGNADNSDLKLKIIGVIKDYNYQSLHEQVEPLVILMYERGTSAAIRYNSGNPADLIKKVEAIWTGLVPNQPFEYEFLTDHLNANYLKEKRMGKIFTLFAVMAILIACLGLFGLASFTIEKRKKEISIRKCLGAPVGNIMRLLLTETIILVIISTFLASPLAWVVMDKWLQNFNYRVEIASWTFIAATLLALSIAVSTILYHVYRASVRNPADSLKMD